MFVVRFYSGLTPDLTAKVICGIFLNELRVVILQVKCLYLILLDCCTKDSDNTGVLLMKEILNFILYTEMSFVIQVLIYMLFNFS